MKNMFNQKKILTSIMELVPFVSQAETKQGTKRARNEDSTNEIPEPIYGNPYWRAKKMKYHKKKGNHKKMARKYKSSRRRSSVTYYDRVAKAVQFRPPYIRKIQGIDDPATPEAWAATQFGMSERLATPAQVFSRAQHGYRGRGLYQGRGAYSLGKMWRKSGLGKTLAGVGRGVINAAGQKAIGAISGMGLYSGRGAYSDMEVGNEVMDGSHMQSAQIESAGDESGSICITNEEYIGDIYAPATTGIFDNTPFPLNPGLEQTFPWLSQLAANYEEYEFKQLVFKFKSAIQDVNSANGQVGTIITATNYNASQKLFPDKPSMSAYYGSVSSKTTDDQVSGVECDPEKLSGPAGHYVRTNPVLVGEDLKSYDHGIFQLATHNIPSSMLNGTLGELRVYYTVVLRKPKFLTARGLAITRCLIVSNGGETATAPFGTVASLLKGQQNNLNVQIALGTNTITLTFPSYYAGNLELKLAVEGSTITGSLISGLSTGGQVTRVNDLYAAGSAGDSPSDYQSAQGSASCVAVMHIRVQPATNATPNTYTITMALGTGTITQATLDISEYNSSFNNTSGAPDLINSAGVIVVP
jgi:hypothetical protein